MYDPSDGLLTFSGASLLPSEPPTPPTPTTPTPDTPRAHAHMRLPMPMPCTPASSTLADMQSLLDMYFRTTTTSGAAPAPARASSTFDFDGLICVVPASDYPSSPAPSTGTGRDKPLPARPPPPPDRDSVFAWSWLGRMAPEDPREPWNVAGARAANASADGFGCESWPSVADSGYESVTGCDDDGDSFYYTPPELEDPNEVRISRS